jgi:DNA helicase HerA-like ATPase
MNEEKINRFRQQISEAYTFKGSSMELGGAMLDHKVVEGTMVRLPYKMLNRHGLVTGATGTGKTKTLQILAENFAVNGIPSIMMDIKGDLSGINQPGSVNDKILSRHEAINIPFEAKGTKVEFLSLSNEPGVRLRATVTEFGPILLAKILELNDTQSGVLAVIFKFSDDHRLPLIDLGDLKAVLQYVQKEGKIDFEASYGSISSTTCGIILRKIIELEGQGAEQFFGELSFEVDDLLHKGDGPATCFVLRLTDLQDRPKLFSTFMMQILAEIYASFPEVGDLDKPRLAIFIDEAHLVFQEASKALLNQIETVVRLIRSKGVSVIFCTQNPTDIPDAVLSQLGLKIQHSLRAFTAKDRKAIKQSAENFPLSEYYNTADLITNLGVGEALITVLDEKARPSMLAHTMLRAPMSRMDVLTDTELNQIIRQSALVAKYNKNLDRESAIDILNQKVNQRHEALPTTRNTTTNRPVSTTTSPRRNQKSTIEKALDNSVTRQIGRTLTREITRGLMGMLGINTTGRRSSTKSTRK